MKPRDMSAITLGEFEEMAKRFGAALTVLRDAQALMGAQSPAAAPNVTPTPAQARPTPIQVVTRAQAEADDTTWRQGLDDEQQAFLESQRRGSERSKLVEAMRGPTQESA